MTDEYINKTELLFEMTTSLIPQDLDITMGYAIAKDLIQKAPVADVAPVVHAHWEFISKNYANCSNCGTIFEALPTDYVFERNNIYCRHCGAYMGGNEGKVI